MEDDKVLLRCKCCGELSTHVKADSDLWVCTNPNCSQWRRKLNSLI